MESNLVCNHTIDHQNQMTTKDLLITSMIKDWIGRHEVLLKDFLIQSLMFAK